MTILYVDGDACPVREETYRVAGRLGLEVFVVSNGSRPMRPSPLPFVHMVTVAEGADIADDWIAERITAADVCITSDIRWPDAAWPKAAAPWHPTAMSGLPEISATPWRGANRAPFAGDRRKLRRAGAADEGRPVAVFGGAGCGRARGAEGLGQGLCPWTPLRPWALEPLF